MKKNMNVSMRRPMRLGLLASVVLGLVVGMLGALPASAAPAAPTELSPNGSEVSGNPILSWIRAPDATSYNVEMSTSPSFDTLAYSATTTNRRATPTTQLPSVPMWWRVRSVSTAGTSAWSLASVDKAGLTGPVVIDPGSSEPLVQPSDPPLLRWKPLNGATSYQVEIDTIEGDFVDAVPYATQTTSLVVQNPQAGGTYTWRVRGVLGAGIFTDWAATRSYEIGPLPSVSQATPANDASGPAIDDVVFDWEPVAGAVTYDLQVDDDDSFSDPIASVIVKGTRYSPPVTYDNDQYWWRVRARNAFGAAEEWSGAPVRQFRRAWPQAPTLLHPADTISPATGDDLYFQWSPVPLATQYRLDVGSDVNFSPGTYKSCFTTETTYTAGRIENATQFDLCMPVPGRTYHWRVQALDGPRNPQVNGIYSPTSKFVYDPGRVTQTSPIAGATVDIPTLRWEPAQDAIEYSVKLSWNGGSTAVTTRSYSWTPTTKLDPAKGPFTWTVQSVDQNGVLSSLPLGGASFNLSGELTTTTADPLTPLSPGPGASATPRFPNLTWEPLANAAYYQVYIGDAGSGNFDVPTEKYPYAAGTEKLGKYLQPGSYDWFVSAHSSGGVNLGTGTTLGTFTVSDLAAVSGQQVALHGIGLDTAGSPCDFSLNGPEGARICTALRATPVLDWDPVPDAGYYMVYVSRDREFTNMVYGSKSSPLTIPTTQNTRWNPTKAMADSQAGDAYYWFIRPCKASGSCAPDPTSAAHAFDKRSHMVEPTAPLQGARVRDEVTFTWTDYLTTNQEPANADDMTGEQSPQAARGYHLQVSTNPAFTGVLVDEATVDQRTYTASSKTYPEGTLYWRIQAVDGAGNQLTWSDARPFTKTSPKVTPLSPVNGQAASTTQPFRWAPLNFAASYDLEVFKDGDETASTTNRVVSANSKQVAYTSAVPLPVAATNYVWRVRGVDVDGRKRDWSTWSSFKVTGDAPVPGTVDGTSMSGRDALFSWSAVEGAASYRYERRQVGGTYSVETKDTVSTAWAPDRIIADGAWQWRVTARDARNVQIGASQWTSFTATSIKPDTTKPTVISKSPTTRPRRATNFVAKFSEPVKNVTASTMTLFVSGRATRLPATVTLSVDKRTATLNPGANLQAGKTYTVRLGSAIADLKGNTMTATSWSVKGI